MLPCLFLALASTVSAAPVFRRQTTLDQAAVVEAQQKDDTATRAFTATPIKTSDGQCLFVDPNSGDFRENLIPIQTAQCDGSDGQNFDVITAGKHNDQPGFALIVSSLTNGCLNFDPRRAAGNQVLLFSCGGRADGGGGVTNSQLFTFNGGSGPLALTPQNGNGAVCLTVTNGKLDQASCDSANPSATELFTIGGGASAGNGSSPAPSPKPSAPSSQPAAPSPSAASPSTINNAAGGAKPSATPATATNAAPAATGTTVLDQAAVAEAQVRDDTATRAFSDVSIKTSDGQCLSVDAQSGDFRENLIPITSGACDGSAGQKWDIITKGVHDNVDGTMLVVSTLTQGCLNFDPRRAAGNQVLLFSCGGRADGGGAVTDSQLFTFSGGAQSSLALAGNGNKGTCLAVSGGALGPATCSQDATQTFTFQ